MCRFIVSWMVIKRDAITSLRKATQSSATGQHLTIGLGRNAVSFALYVVVACINWISAQFT